MPYYPNAFALVIVCRLSSDVPYYPKCIRIGHCLPSFIRCAVLSQMHSHWSLFAVFHPMCRIIPNAFALVIVCRLSSDVPYYPKCIRIGHCLPSFIRCAVLSQMHSHWSMFAGFHPMCRGGPCGRPQPEWPSATRMAKCTEWRNAPNVPMCLAIRCSAKKNSASQRFTRLAGLLLFPLSGKSTANEFFLGGL